MFIMELCEKSNFVQCKILPNENIQEPEIAQKSECNHFDTSVCKLTWQFTTGKACCTRSQGRSLEVWVVRGVTNQGLGEQLLHSKWYPCSYGLWRSKGRQSRFLQKEVMLQWLQRSFQTCLTSYFSQLFWQYSHTQWANAIWEG